MKFRHLLLFVILTIASRFLIADEPATPLPRAHAHNDYLHPRPLLDALDHGFCSVEADIFLVSGQLLVAHERRDVRPERTLESMYLEPLRKRVLQNGGRVYPNGPTFWLLIDIKSDGPATYGVLKDLLAKYSDILTAFGDRVERKAVSVVISGNRPRDLIAADAVRYAGVDGRLTDLASTESEDLLPWISDNWSLAFRWRGIGPFPEIERRKLHDIVARAHERKRLVRFWATPDVQTVWDELLAADVDLINTDYLAGLRSYLSKSPLRRNE